jgi:hypothetical protein
MPANCYDWHRQESLCYVSAVPGLLPFVTVGFS